MATQTERRARSRARLLEATARAISQHGYGRLNLAAVAADAGYTRGALYHQFAAKDDLVLATVEWVRDAWFAEVGTVFAEWEDLDPVDAVLELARRHAEFCRRDVAGVMLALRVELAGQEDHPVGAAIRATGQEITERTRRLIVRGRRAGAIPAGPSARVTAAALLAAVEAAAIALRTRPGDDAILAERLARGALSGVSGTRTPHLGDQGPSRP